MPAMKNRMFFVRKRIGAVKSEPGEVFYSVSHHLQITLWTTCFCSLKTSVHKGNVRLHNTANFQQLVMRRWRRFYSDEVTQESLSGTFNMSAQTWNWVKDWEVSFWVSLGLFSLRVLYSETQHFLLVCSGRKTEKKKDRMKFWGVVNCCCLSVIGCDIVWLHLIKTCPAHISPQNKKKRNMKLY